MVTVSCECPCCQISNCRDNSRELCGYCIYLDTAVRLPKSSIVIFLLLKSKIQTSNLHSQHGGFWWLIMLGQLRLHRPSCGPVNWWPWHLYANTYGCGFTTQRVRCMDGASWDPVADPYLCNAVTCPKLWYNHEIDKIMMAYHTETDKYMQSIHS